MNIVLFDRDEKSLNSQVELSGRRAKHLLDVVRVQAGDQLRVGEINGQLGSARVARTSASNLVLDEIELVQDAPQPWIDLVLGLPRPRMLNRILQSLASLGVAKVYLIGSERVEKSFFHTPALQPESIKDHLLLGLEQGGHTSLPEIIVQEKPRAFFSETLPGIFSNYQTAICAHPRASRKLSELQEPISPPNPFHSSTIGALGPEGGWVNPEVELFEKQGFEIFSFNSRILRVETAVVFFLAQLEMLKELSVKPFDQGK